MFVQYWWNFTKFGELTTEPSDLSLRLKPNLLNLSALAGLERPVTHSSLAALSTLHSPARRPPLRKANYLFMNHKESI
ncbi:hypothetical protein AOLI_G00090980 [Acnodon oligacanthus]